MDGVYLGCKANFSLVLIRQTHDRIGRAESLPGQVIELQNISKKGSFGNWQGEWSDRIRQSLFGN